MPPSRSLPCYLAMVNPIMFFDIAVNSEPLDHVSFKLFADSSKDSRVVTSHAIMVLVASPSMVRNMKMHISSWSTQILESCPWQMQAPTQTVPSFSSALSRQSGWMANMWSLVRWKRAWILWKPWSALGPGMARLARRSPLLTVDKSNKFDLCST